MKVTAVICEYNLFHAGHARLNAAIRAYWAERGEECAILSVMSGNYVQRGEMAILPKYLRAEAAVRAGVDLVLELPYPWSGGAAEYFASGAVSLICSLGGVDALAFGSESGDLALLEQTARNLSAIAYSAALTAARAADGRESELRLRDRVYAELYGVSLPKGANALLGTEYLRALLHSDPNGTVTPITFTRLGEETATETRRRMTAGEPLDGLVPPEAAAVFAAQKPIRTETVSDAVIAAFRLGSPAAFAAYEGAGDGLAERLCRAANECADLPSMLAKCATKKYTNAHIRRTLFNCLFGTTRQMLRSAPMWTEVLASNARGRTILRRLKKSSECVILTKPSHFSRCTDPRFAAQHTVSCRADALYAQAMRAPSALFLRAVPYIAQE